MQEILGAAGQAFNSLHSGYQDLLSGIASRESISPEECAFDQKLLAFVKSPKQK